MYLEFFNLREQPFSIAPNPRYLYMSARYQEALAHLLYGVNEGGGFVLLTGEVGTGKTTLCHCLLGQLPQEVLVAYVFNPRLNALELLATICDELRIPYPKDCTSLKVFIDRLNHYLLAVHARGRRTIVVIDEAQNLSFEVLEQIRLLTNLETPTTKLLQIILIGQPELNQLIQQKRLRQLNQRIAARYHLYPLSRDETKTYINHRLAVSGRKTPIFTTGAINKIYEHSAGIPRLINLICDRALLGAYTLSQPHVSTAVATKAAREVVTSQPVMNTPWWKIPLWAGAASALAILLLLGGGYYLHERGSLPPANARAAVTTPPKPPVTPASTEPPAAKAAATNNKTPSANDSTLSGKVVNILPTQPTVNYTVNPLPPSKPTPTFAEYIADPVLDLTTAFASLLHAWNIKNVTPTQSHCTAMAAIGLQCLLQQGTWNQVVKLNRPVILELLLDNLTKRFVTVKEIKDDQLTLVRGDNESHYPLNEVLTYWRGSYALLWKPLEPHLTRLAQGMTSIHVTWVRDRLSMKDPSLKNTARPSFFDATLRQRLMEFQKANGITPTGVVGAQTFILLGNMADDLVFPRLSANK